MYKDTEKFDHLINNLEKTTSKNSIFNYESGRKAFLSLGQGHIREWLETLLPNTRLILEPKIIGSCIGIQYINGTINKAINKNSIDITQFVNSLKNVPKTIPIKQIIEIQGVLYDDVSTLEENNLTKSIHNKKASIELNEVKFCAFQIFHCEINQFQSLQELKKLNFKIPETQFSKRISEIEIYRETWKEGKLFQGYPTSGIVLKVNSRKLQKCLGENNLVRHWAYAIN